MAVFKNRASILAVKAESTEGTLVFPAAGTDYLALQEGFEFNSEFQSLSNDEIRSSIGEAAPITGLETPSGSFSHYLRHSNVEGTAPNYNLLLKSLLGSVSTNSTQRTTTVGSTTSVIELGAGGSDFARGKAILLKDATNNYSIRPVHSVSTNSLTLGFAVGTAPATGINTGKCINYAPADTGHPTLSMHLYRGNGGAIEAIAGARITQGAINIAAGQLINAQYNFNGTKYFLNPLVVDVTNNKLNFTDDDGTVTATIASATYRDPYELAAAVTDAMNAANTGETHTCSYLDASGKFKIVSTGTVLSLLWKTGTNGSDNTDTHIGTLLGFSDTADDTGTLATTGYTSDNAMTLTNSITPTYDSADPLVAKDNECFIGDVNDNTCFKAQSVQINVNNNVQAAEAICATSGIAEYLIDRRSIEINVVAILPAYDIEKFYSFRSNSDVRFCYNFGVKSANNWVAGKCGCIYVPSAKVSAHKLGENNGVCTVQLTIKPYVDASGNGEFYINFL